MPGAFGQGMALGFQALSAKRQREQEERQQQLFDFGMEEKRKDVEAERIVGEFAKTLYDPSKGAFASAEEARASLAKYLPQVSNNPNAMSKMVTLLGVNPNIGEESNINKLNQEITKKKWEIDYQDMKQRGRMELGALLRPSSIAGGSKGKPGKELAEYPKRDIKELNVIVGRDEGGNPIYEQRSIFSDTGVETHKLSPRGVPVLNPDDPIVQKHYGTYDDVWKALRHFAPDATKEDIDELAYLAYNTPANNPKMIADYNRLLPFKAPSGTRPLGIPSPQFGPLLYEGMEPMKKLDAAQPPAPAGRFKTLTEQPNTLRGMATMIPEAQALVGFGNEPLPTEPSLSRLAPVATPGLASLPGQYDKPLSRYRNVPVKEAVNMAYDAIKKQGMTDLADFPKLNQAFEEVLQGTEDAAIDQLQNAIPRVLARLWADTKALGEIDEEANERAQRQLLFLMKTPGNALNNLYRTIFNAFDYMGKGVVRGVEALGEIPTPLQVERR